MNEIEKRLGENIRAARMRRKISSEELARRMGTGITGRTIRCYETGTRSVNTETLVRIALALDCSLQTLVSGLDPRVGPDAGYDEYKMLTSDEHDIFKYMATEWEGNRHSLIMFIGLYMALPVKYRCEAPLSLLAQAERALKDKAIDESQLPLDMSEFELMWRKLYEEQK